MSKVRCLTCDKVMESKHRRDWVSCNCDPQSDTWMYIDGGTEYFRMGAGNSAKWDVLEE